MQHIEVDNDSLGRPFLHLSGAASERAELLEIGDIQLSLSDEDEYAIAYVMASK